MNESLIDSAALDTQPAKPRIELEEAPGQEHLA